ncbi:MAG: MATE family efflux transporter [Prevotellaceae bacterium]|jgi:putative MATE family efflux protein|nr:MATE family efflux transporter [Prevotellaceae bacterium]
MERVEKGTPRELETEKVSVLLWRYAIPAIISSSVVALYNIVDRMYLGHMGGGVGAMAISGLAITFPLLVLLQAFGTLVGVGAATRVSIVLGMKDLRWAENILAHSLIMLLCISGSIIVLSMIFLTPLLELFGGTEQTIPYAKDYLIYVVPGSIFTSLSFGAAGMMRSTGYPAKSMQVILLGAILNTLIDPIFIFWLDMGIRGAGIATVIAMGTSAIYGQWHFFRPDSYLRYRRYAFRLKKEIIWSILAIGMSPFLINAVGAGINIEINQLLVKHGGDLAVEHGGDLAVGVYGIICAYGMMVVMIVFGFCQGMQPIVGYNYGAGRKKRVKDTYLLTVKYASIVTGIGFAMAMLIPWLMARAFTSDPTMLGIAIPAIRISFVAFAIIGFQIVTGQFFQAIGKVKNAIILSLSRQLIFLAPALYLSSIPWGVTGVWAAMSISDVLAAGLALLMLWRAKELKIEN